MAGTSTTPTPIIDASLAAIETTREAAVSMCSVETPIKGDPGKSIVPVVLVTPEAPTNAARNTTTTDQHPAVDANVRHQISEGKPAKEFSSSSQPDNHACIGKDSQNVVAGGANNEPPRSYRQINEAAGLKSGLPVPVDNQQTKAKEEEADCTKTDQEQAPLEAEAEIRSTPEAGSRIKAGQNPSGLISQSPVRSMADYEGRLKAEYRKAIGENHGIGEDKSQTHSQTQTVEASKIVDPEPTLDNSADKSRPSEMLIPESSEVAEKSSNGQYENAAPNMAYNKKQKPKPDEGKYGNNSEKENTERGASAFCGVSLTSVFGTDEKDEERGASQEQLADLAVQLRSSPVSFASAFGGEPELTRTTMVDSVFPEACGGTNDSPQPISHVAKSSEFPGAPPSTKIESPTGNSTFDTSLTAFGAAKNKRVSSLVSKYMDNVSKEPLPGDALRLEPSSSRSIDCSPNPSSITPSSSMALNVDVKDLPKIGDIRAKFEDSSKSSHSHELLFGEAFRQKQRFSLLAEKERKKEAKTKMHGASYDAVLLSQGKQATGEVDTSSIEKRFSFQTDQDPNLHDGSCKVDYLNETYQGMVFVVHRTRGMLLFNHFQESNQKAKTPGGTCIPGGSVCEEEFIAAAKQTSYAKMQLQLAAREGAARQLFETTGIDMRNNLDRLTPAVLQINPPVDAKGAQYLKNEHERKLYYFLQICDDDFFNAASAETEGSSQMTAPSGEIGSPLKLKLGGGFTDFTFIKDPLAAAGELNDNGDPSVTTALSMVMNQSFGHGVDPAGAISYERKSHGLGTSNVAGQTEGEEWTGTMTMISSGQDTKQGGATAERTDDEANLKQKASTDSAQQEIVTCCCGFW